jgi:outer membrane receptor protein involved in Fe transport
MARASRIAIGALALVAALGGVRPPLLAQAASSPDDTPSVSGTVKDTLGGVLPGVTITALNIASGGVAETTTDGRGEYRFAALAPGSYRVSARLAGFSEAGKSVRVVHKEAVTADFELGLGGLSEEITVTAAKGQRATAEVNQIVTIVSADDIEARRPQGVQEALERAPNVRSIDTNPYRARPQFRGFSNSRVLLIVDGERLNNGRYDVAASGTTPSTIDVSQIESIEVVGGAASSLYGSDAIAGTINIITKTADRPAAGRVLDVTVNGDVNGNSSFARGNVAAAFASPKVAVRGAVSVFNQPDYRVGGDDISKEEVVRLGQMIADGGALVGRNVAGTYAVYELGGGDRVANGGAKGYTYNVDASLFPNPKHMVRVKWLSNRFDDLGLPFSTPPYDTFTRTSYFADFDKLSARYEVREIAPWFPRLAVSGYRQELKRPQNDISYTIVQGSSYVGSRLTGNLSQFVKGVDTETINDITSKGADVQANLQPFRALRYTTGVQFTMDTSVDTFNRTSFSATGAVLTSVRAAKTTPDTDYRNLGWYHQVEWSPARVLRLSGGFRTDNWKTEGKPSNGFPAGNEYRIIQAALPQITANPGPITVSGIQGVDQLVSGQGSLKTDVSTTTGNAGVTVLLPGGINPYVRYATSFREPEITVRYLVRNFGQPIISVQSLPNTTVKPEKGKNIDTGVKVERERVRGQLGFFHNRLTNAVANVFSPSYCIPVNPAGGILPTPFPPCLFTGSHAAQFFQRVNVPGDVTVKGFEAAGEVAIPLGSKGSLNPFLSVGWQRGRNSAPTASAVTLMNAYYNRDDTPIKLEGTPDDAPYGELPAWTGTFAPRYSDAKGAWWMEYEWRWASRITRVDPDAVFSTNFPLYGGLKSLEGYDKHSVRAGYDFKDRFPLKLTVGLENLTNATYFLPFQNGPSPGFSFLLGATVNMRMRLD